MPYVEGNTLGDLLSAEVLPAWSRDTVTLDERDADLPLGTVLQAGADGAVPWATGTDAIGVLAEAVPAGAAGVKVAVIARGAVLNKALIGLPDSGLFDEAAASLAASGIVIREVL
ncbi:MAG: head decoration protein [Zoogloeaceae bacterium]|jgi:hypothetical protein|nr:head decoration protein [Zoogloeaceae bacterium]